MSAVHRLHLSLLLVAIAVAVSVHAQNNLVEDGPERIQLADPVISADKLQRHSSRNKPTPRPPGFFGTIWKLVVEQANDTKSGYQQLSEIFSGQFSDDQPTTKKPTGNNNNNSTSTEQPPKISRKQFLDILRRNLIGLRRLYNLEVREAMADSKKNIQDYKKEFNRKLYEQFRD